MEPDTWPYHCIACNMNIPNPISWNAHKEGKKHVVKEKELKRRQAEGKRTVYVTGEVVTTPVAELLLREYFQSTFGEVEKIICQENFCLVIFESETVSESCSSQKEQEFSGYKIHVKPRIQNFGASFNNAKTLEIINKLNTAADLSKQLAIVDSFYGGGQIQLFQTTLEGFIERLKAEVGQSVNFVADLIGSAKYQLQTPSSDFDINFRVGKVNSFALEEKFIEIGRKTVRNEPHSARKERDQTAVVLFITGKIVSLSKTLPISSVHAVIGARKPVIRMNLSGKKLEISIGNTAASVNTRFFETCFRDHLFLHLVKMTKFIFSHGELSKAGRLSSYSTLIAMYSFLIEKKIAKPIDQLVAQYGARHEEGLEEDGFCKKQWDYRLPNEVPFEWPVVSSKEEAVKLLFKLFFEFSHWLSSVESDIVVNIRSDVNPNISDFFSSYQLTEQLFKAAVLNIADPFEVEHNTTGHITAKTLHKMSKVLKSFAIKGKMKRVTNFIENQKATAHDSKDWGISLLIGTGENRMDAGQSCGLVTSSRTTKAGNEFSLNVDSTKKSEFFAFLDKVLRVQMPEKLINESMEDMEISPKKSKMSEEMSSDSFDSGHESIGECFNCSVEFKLWEGRRGTRRQLEREYKNAKPIDIESQVSAILLGKTPKKLGEAMAFRLQVADAGIRLLPEKKSQEFSELFRFLEQAVTKYFLAEA